MTNYYAVKIEATNDINGNPRRGWLIYRTDGALVGFADEGYRGSGALKITTALLAGHTSWTKDTDVEWVNGGVEATGPDGAVRLCTLGVLSVPVAEYRTAMRATKGASYATDSEYRFF